jgi:hypothetical protein
MLDQADEDQALDTPEALRDDAEYASLARHAATDNGPALIAAVCPQVEDWERGGLVATLKVAHLGLPPRNAEDEAHSFATASTIAMAMVPRPRGAHGQTGDRGGRVVRDCSIKLMRVPRMRRAMPRSFRC